MNQTQQQPVPRQRKGAQSDVWHSKRFAGEQQATDFFKEARRRLLDVSNWEKLCKGVSAEFVLTDANGNEVQRAAKENDHFKISIPGPGSKTGDGYDWVRILKIRDDEVDAIHYQQVSMTVTPASNPLNKDAEAAHFFKEGATSTFIVTRNGSDLLAEVHGRNELPNLRAGTWIDRVRNAAVAFLATLGLASTQWKKLARGLIDPSLKL